MRNKLLSGGAGVCVAILLSASAPGQSVRFLMPESFETTVGQAVEVRMVAGPQRGAAPIAWRAEEVDHFFIRAAGTQENVEQIRTVDAAQTAVSVQPDRPGVVLIGLDRRPHELRLTPAETAEFLAARASRMPDADKAPVRRLDARLRVRHVESAKTVIRVTDAEGHGYGSGIANSKSGQAVEIRPLFDPTMLMTHSDLPVRLYVQNGSAAGATVRATHTASGATVQAVGDSSGITSLRIDQPGVWQLEFHVAEPGRGPGGPDLTIYTATLTFEVTREGVPE